MRPQRFPDGGASRRRRWRTLALAALSIVLVIAAFTVPIPIFYMYLPGPVRDVERLVVVDGARTYSSDGALYLTTVSLDIHVTLDELLAAAIHPDESPVPSWQVTRGQTPQQLEREQRLDMTSSKRRASEVALSALGLGEAQGDGARVRRTIEALPADGVLQEGDVIVSVGGLGVDTTCEVAAAIDRVDVGEEVAITVLRDGDHDTVTVETASDPENPGSPVIGVLMADVNYRFRSGVEVDFKTGEIAGPSAGLMFALALYDRLSPEDLTGGRSIAGTGTIDCSGDVGQISGIVQKVAAAESHGADVFLAPAQNAAEARAAADDMAVVSVSTFSDALDYLHGSRV
jgi:PDZ domain-containing protein